MPDWITVARLVRPRGIRGELVAEAGDYTPDQFLAFPRVLARPGDRELSIVEARAHQHRLLLKFDGIDTPEQAETLRGAELCIAREHRPALAADEYYFSDLKGCRMVDYVTGAEIGTVSDCLECGGPILLQVQLAGGGEALVPLARAICREVDVAARRIRAELPAGLIEAQREDGR